MRRMLSSLALVLALNAGMIAPASAGGDWGYSNGVNPYGVATPVPAPAPVPVYDANWYFRIDFGAGMGGDPSVSATGAPFGLGPVPALVPFGFDANWLSTNYDAMFTATGGIGYIWGPHFRTDFTVDLRSLGDVTYSGSQIYTTAGSDRLVRVSDKTEMNSVPLLINGYYDFLEGKSLRPYLGAGIGFTVNRLNRNHTSTDFDCAGTSPCVPPGAGTPTTANDSNYNISLAAAAMAGLTYNWSSYTAIDVNYRYMYIGGSDADLRINGVGTKVKIGDINEHQIRVGLRFNVH